MENEGRYSNVYQVMGHPLRYEFGGACNKKSCVLCTEIRNQRHGIHSERVPHCYRVSKQDMHWIWNNGPHRPNRGCFHFQFNILLTDLVHKSFSTQTATHHSQSFHTLIAHIAQIIAKSVFVIVAAMRARSPPQSNSIQPTRTRPARLPQNHTTLQLLSRRAAESERPKSSPARLIPSSFVAAAHDSKSDSWSSSPSACHHLAGSFFQSPLCALNRDSWGQLSICRQL